MSADVPTKECQFCYSQIDGRAKKCPRCQMLQGIWLPAVFGLIFLPFILLVALLVGVSAMRQPSREDHSRDVAVVESSLFFTPAIDFHNRDTEAMKPCVVGLLKNDGEHALQHVELEVHVFDETDKLIDVFHNSVYGIYEPASEIGFKITSDEAIHMPESKYHAHKIFVVSAFD